MKPKKKKLPTISSLRNKLDFEFNSYIRERDKYCVLCGSPDNLQCSHFFGKQARPATRWNERNAHAMCAKCHFLHHHGREADYAVWMVEEYGLEGIETLQRESRSESKFARAWYEDMKIVYHEKRKGLTEKE